MDRLTQLQDCLDQLTNQMHSCLAYINDRAPTSRIEGQPDMNPLQNMPRKEASAAADGVSASQSQPPATQASTNASASQQPAGDKDDGGAKSPGYIPDPPEVFQESLRELARDLILKEQQIEYLIGVLPGIGQSERAQEARMKELEGQLRDVEEERKEALKEKEALLMRLDSVIAKVRRY